MYFQIAFRPAISAETILALRSYISKDLPGLMDITGPFRPITFLDPEDQPIDNAQIAILLILPFNHMEARENTVLQQRIMGALQGVAGSDKIALQLIYWPIVTITSSILERVPMPRPLLSMQGHQGQGKKRHRVGN